MSSSHDIIAQVLAAEDHPHLLEETPFKEAVATVEVSAKLQAELQEARTFLARHPVLLDTSVMPQDVRERIATELAKANESGDSKGEMILGPWQIRRNFAWAAALVLLLTGMSMLSSVVLDRQDARRHQFALQQMPPQDAFRAEVGRLVNRRIPLQERSSSSTQLVSWMGEQGWDNLQAPDPLMKHATFGCAEFEAPFGKFGVVCFDVHGEVVHLFVACTGDMGLKEERSPERMKLQGREALQWNDEENLYLFIPHEVDTELPEIFL